MKLTIRGGLVHSADLFCVILAPPRPLRLEEIKQYWITFDNTSPCIQYCLTLHCLEGSVYLLPLHKDVEILFTSFTSMVGFLSKLAWISKLDYIKA